ncbi:flagellar biosynthesis protein FlhB [Sneathiella chinensis]|uniref:Flagellar biosynthetic protein FlhB n=1 Tax=Sneathiella chinensis TaxID=349750 RepID=A0ABQ5U7S9_9PROT|nr:flagellar biosynthesis protein FlhB [Sneathiella chinensis]GLQ07329.1 flagellar biosynthesis protein FlhB [Sneathiella chinensis]
MADDQDDAQKTEEPTSKKLEDAHKKGQVPKSQEVGHWFMTMGITLVILIFMAGLGKGLTFDLVKFIEQPHAINVDALHLRNVFGDLGWAVIAVLAPVLGILMLAGLVGTVIQHRPVLSLERIKPSWNKVSLLGGLKRLFSMKSLSEFVKGILKLVLVGTVAFLFVLPEMDQLPLLMTYDILSLFSLLQTQLLSLLAGVVAVMSVIAGFDYMYQRYNHHKELRMTKQEIKDEHKQSEGDPMIKSRLRSIRMQRSRQRMMQAVPSADVVVTNPTHFAVALRYKQDTDGAPVVLAKGTDNIALKIREIANENNIPIVENPPLARALHKSCELDEEIPYEHYRAVAEIIGYVMKLNKNKRR